MSDLHRYLRIAASNAYLKQAPRSAPSAARVPSHVRRDRVGLIAATGCLLGGGIVLPVAVACATPCVVLLAAGFVFGGIAALVIVGGR